jgi:outer membrane protein TolC
LAIGALWAFGAPAQQRIPLTLAEAEDLALQNEPGQTALLARSSALRERSVVASQLPDPAMRVGLNNYPIESGSFSTEGMTHALVGVRQAFPPGDSRAIESRQFSAMAAQQSAHADARGLEVRGATRQAWLESYYWQQARDLVASSRPFFDDLAQITRSLYAVGRRNQQDVLRAELELSRLDDRLIEMSRQLAASQAALGQWIGDSASRPVARALPSWGAPPAREQILSGLGQHPLLQAADAAVAAGNAGVELAEEQRKPGWSIDLGYSYRDGYLADGDPRSDFVSLSVTVDLPYFNRKQRSDRYLAAALSERSAVMGTREQLHRKLASRVDAEYAKWEQTDRRLSLYEARMLPQSSEQAQAALAAYQSAIGDFADVMRGYIDDLNTRLDFLRLQVDRAQSHAELKTLGGFQK